MGRFENLERGTQKRHLRFHAYLVHQEFKILDNVWFAMSYFGRIFDRAQTVSTSSCFLCLILLLHKCIYLGIHGSLDQLMSKQNPFVFNQYMFHTYTVDKPEINKVSFISGHYEWLIYWIYDIKICLTVYTTLINERRALDIRNGHPDSRRPCYVSNPKNCRQK